MVPRFEDHFTFLLLYRLYVLSIIFFLSGRYLKVLIYSSVDFEVIAIGWGRQQGHLLLQVLLREE